MYHTSVDLPVAIINTNTRNTAQASIGYRSCSVVEPTKVAYPSLFAVNFLTRYALAAFFTLQLVGCGALMLWLKRKDSHAFG